MNILLTGSDGFIGSHLHSHLKDKHNVIGIDLKNGHDLLTCELPDVDLVIHLAGLSGVRDSLNRPTDYWKTNVIGGQRLFDRYKDTRVIYASSSTAHEPWKNPYAMSKYSLEQIAHKNSVGMRFTTVYGPNARENMLIPMILRNDVHYMNSNHSRDFIHVYDILSAIDAIMNNEVYGVLDIGTGETNRLLDIADYFKIDCIKMIGDETERLDNKADVTVLNNLGWQAKINLFKYIEENRNVN